MEFKLILKKLNNTISSKEELIFKAWCLEKKEHKQFFDKVKANYSNTINVIDIEEAWRKIVNRIDTPKTRKRYWKFAVASIAIGLLTSVYFLKDNIFSDSTENRPTIVNKNVIHTGTDKAVLTLEDGSQIALEKGASFQSKNLNSNGEQLVYDRNEEIEDSKIAYNYLTIPRGGQFFVKLSDGTQVWLNSESQLKFPVNFKKGEIRKVELVYGEAYFDVSPSSDHHGADFKVYNNKQEIHVLGTEFNIKAYKDEVNIYTTLVEGKVALSYEDKKLSLLPNQQSNINIENNQVFTKTVDVYNEISWKDGVFSFDDKSLKEIMKVLSRWYDMEVYFENKSLEKEAFIGRLGKKQSIEDILINIKNFGIINEFKITDRNVVLE
ncbi:FecR family protein [Mariniflexile litorale]|uniref:FecR family protein n=1 Tax=Mariniflexile litorale TaxID=3045158 RepID=A0AAU7EES5_9FLAO|nr:FecR family protein [Mariniflexile sp. KMM 9835]MDQ8211920.1 FecR family protein [Mariniflexile sp. KMM 9835]